MEYKALEGIVVLDFTKVLAGPYCGSILADFGADVIKIELPGKGDDARTYGPIVNGESLYYANLNRGKRGITLNLKTEQGKEVFKKLVRKADILIENNRPGVMERLGLGYEELSRINPRLIYGKVSGFGSTGPYADRPGYDIISQAMGGLMSVTGEKGGSPTRSGNAMGDVLGGMNLTIGILMALEARNRSGRGQVVDIALVDSVIACLEQAWQRYFTSGKIPVRHGNSYDAVAPYDSYRAKDGYLVIGCGNQKLFEVLCLRILNRPELITDERFATMPLRVENQMALKKVIEEWMQDMTVDEAVKQVLDVGIPAGPIMSLDMIANDVHFTEARQMFEEIDYPGVGTIKLNNSPIKLSESKAKIRGLSPRLGEHNKEILMNLGYSDQQIEEMKENGVF